MSSSAGCLLCGVAVLTDDPEGWLYWHRAFAHEGRRLYLVGASGSPERCSCGRLMAEGRCPAPPGWRHDGGYGAEP